MGTIIAFCISLATVTFSPSTSITTTSQSDDMQMEQPCDVVNDDLDSLG